MSQNKKEHRRFIAKVQNVEGKNGTFQKIAIENPNPFDKEGNEDKYYKGNLMWFDKETGKHFIVKQLSFAGVPEKSKQYGFVSSIYIDLDNTYDVSETE